MLENSPSIRTISKYYCSFSYISFFGTVRTVLVQPFFPPVSYHSAGGKLHYHIRSIPLIYLPELVHSFYLGDYLYVSSIRQESVAPGRSNTQP